MLRGRHEVVQALSNLFDAVFALGEDDLVLIVKRVEALAAFLETEDGANLLAGYKRAANILKAEEKKDGDAIEVHRCTSRCRWISIVLFGELEIYCCLNYVFASFEFGTRRMAGSPASLSICSRSSRPFWVLV